MTRSNSRNRGGGAQGSPQGQQQAGNNNAGTGGNEGGFRALADDNEGDEAGLDGNEGQEGVTNTMVTAPNTSTPPPPPPPPGDDAGGESDSPVRCELEAVTNTVAELTRQIQALQEASNASVAEARAAAVGQKVAEVMASHNAAQAPPRQPASTTKAGRAKLPEPDTFDGESEDVRRFITQAREYRKYYVATSTEEDILRILAGRLREGPAHWAQGEIEASRSSTGRLPWRSVDAFLRQLKALWLDPNEMFRAYDRLATIKVSKFTSWNAFMSEMRGLWTLVPFLPHLRAHAIVRALPQHGTLLPTLGSQQLWVDWRADPVSMDDETFNRFVRMVGSAARSIIFRQSDKIMGKGTPSSPLSLASSTTSSGAVCSQMDSSKADVAMAQVFGIMADYRKKLGASLFKKLKDARACFNCHREDCPGAKECRKPPASLHAMTIDGLAPALHAAGFPSDATAVLAAMQAVPEEQSPEAPDAEEAVRVARLMLTQAKAPTAVDVAADGPLI